MNDLKLGNGDSHIGGLHEESDIAYAKRLTVSQRFFHNLPPINERAVRRSAVPDPQSVIRQYHLAMEGRDRNMLQLEVISLAASELVNPHFEVDYL